MVFVPDPEIDARTPYSMECVFCEKVAEDILPQSLSGVTNLLVRMQEHLMSDHGVEQAEFRNHTNQLHDGVYHFYRPDGSLWMKATPRGILGEPNPALNIYFDLERGPLLRWRLDRPWDQKEFMMEIGRLGAQYGLGINLDLPPQPRDPDDIQRAHDCLWAWVMGEAPGELAEEDQRSAQAALEALCWVLGHDHLVTFQENLDNLGWRDMGNLPEEEEL